MYVINIDIMCILAVKNQYLPTMTLWSSKDIEASKTVVHHPNERMKWTGEQTWNEKVDKLNIHVGGSLSVDLNTAKVKAKGSFSYITEKKV